MITRIKLYNFKRFNEEQFEITDNVILAGPNNTGKSTLLQAIAVWSLALRKWLNERGPASKSKARQRSGVAITRKDFTAVPLREMNLLWTGRSTALSRRELENGQKLGTPRLLEIRLEGIGQSGKKWALAFEFSYQNSELVYAKPAKDTPVTEDNQAILAEMQLVHIPPFSGIGAEETRYDPAYQDFLIGQGKPGDIVRNLLLDVSKNKENWNELSEYVRKIFGYQLLEPVYAGQPFIVCEYQPLHADMSAKKKSRLDIACAGSGFLQVLTLLGFFYARPASVLLLDEPDEHLHIILQKQMYDELRKISRTRGCQLFIATHAEVLIDNTPPEHILFLNNETR